LAKPGKPQVALVKKLASSDRHFLRTLVALCLALLFSSFASSAGKDLKKHFGLIFGTAYGPDDRPVYGARIEIHPVGQKHPTWVLTSDHRGEFAQRVTPGPADYLVTGEMEYAPIENGTSQTKKKKKMKAETKVHIQAEERQDVSLHFKE